MCSMSMKIVSVSVSNRYIPPHLRMGAAALSPAKPASSPYTFLNLNLDQIKVVTRSGSGVITGVYFLRGDNNQFDVVKFPLEPENEFFCLGLAEILGMRAPRVKMLRMDDAFEEAFFGQLNKCEKVLYEIALKTRRFKACREQRQHVAALKACYLAAKKKTPYFLAMEYFIGSDLERNVESPQEWTQDVLRSQAFWVGLGHKFVFSLLIGDGDGFEFISQNNKSNVFFTQEDPFVVMDVSMDSLRAIYPEKTVSSYQDNIREFFEILRLSTTAEGLIEKLNLDTLIKESKLPYLQEYISGFTMGVYQMVDRVKALTDAQIRSIAEVEINLDLLWKNLEIFRESEI